MQNTNVKRILCIVGSMDAGGAETFLMKIYRSIDRSKYQFDFLVCLDKEGIYDQEILVMGGKIYYSESKSANFIKYTKGIYNTVKENKYEYVLRMSSNSFATLDLLIAKMAGAQQLVMRSTNAGAVTGMLGKILNELFFWMPKVIPTVKIAPSTEAAEYVFGKGCVGRGEVTLIKNAIPIEVYRYDENKRNIIRKEFNIANNFVVGHVGRFSCQKNHKFLIKVFAEIVKIKPEAKLMLVGKGELENDIREQILLLGISDKVIFTGVRKDVPALLMSMDVMVFPSLFEGMPNVIIEAQATGLMCVLSDKVTREVAITDVVSFVAPTEDGLKEWKKRALVTNNFKRQLYFEKVKVAGYDVLDIAGQFTELVFN